VKSVAVAVMAKVPGFGPLKTRLCPPLTPALAASLYRCFLLDKVAQVVALRDAADPMVAFTPAEGRSTLTALIPSGVRLIPQEGPDLGARLHHLLAGLLQERYGGACAVDSDTPTLPAAYLREGCEILGEQRADVVLGPTEDGGYYLVGLTMARRELFEGIPWSTPKVLPETLRRARQLGLRVHQLPPWFDVDTGEDLRRLKAAERLPERTARFLEMLSL